MSAADGPAAYCGTIAQGDQRELIYATREGLWARPQRRVMRQVSRWMAVDDWRDTGAEAQLIATEAELVAVLLRVPEVVRQGLVEAWKRVVEMRAAAREVVLGPGEWTVVDMPGASA